MRKKESCYIKDDGEFSMFDTCYCASKDCLQDCCRKRSPTGIVTVSDFSSICKEYVNTQEKLQAYRRKKRKELEKYLCDCVKTNTKKLKENKYL